MNDHGGKRQGAGRKPNLTHEQELDLWLYLHRIKAWAWKRNRKKWKIANENSKRNSELARSYERIKQVQIAHRPLLAAAGELEKIDEETFEKLVIAEQNFHFDKKFSAIKHKIDTFNLAYRDHGLQYMSRKYRLKRILTRSEICEIGSRYAFRRFCGEIQLKQVERIWRKHGIIF